MKIFFQKLKGGLGFGLGILITLFVGSVIASLNSVEPGDTLTANKWNELVGNVNSLNNEMENIKNENISMNVEIENLKNESISLGGLNDNIEILSNEIDNLKNQNNSANSNITSLNAEIQTLKGQNNSINIEIQALKNQNASLKSLTPQGAIIAFNLSSCPSGWLPANGENGTPDLRGRFIRGLGGSANGEDETRALGSYQGDAIRNITGHFGAVNGGNFNDNINSDGTFSGVFSGYIASQEGQYTQNDHSRNTVVWFNAASVVPTASDNRPKNIALIYCVKE